MTGKTKVQVLSQEEIASGIMSLRLSAPDAAETARPGQFVSLYCSDGTKLLPRPISIYETDRTGGTLHLVYRIAGGGTKEFSGLSAGSTIDMLGPLGQGYQVIGKRHLLIGGGIGIPPLLALCQSIPAGNQITAVLGYRDSAAFLSEAFRKAGASVLFASDDGSLGVKGTVMDVLKDTGLSADMIYACGPIPMLAAVKAWAEQEDIRAQLSLEERMACGIGACLGCVVKSTHTDAHSMVRNKRVCKDGPVFFAEEIEL